MQKLRNAAASEVPMIVHFEVEPIASIVIAVALAVVAALTLRRRD